MRKLRVIAIAAGIAIGVGFFGQAAADPISCPAGQTATKTDDFWSCVNSADHQNESGDSSNPNGNPNFRR